MEMIQELDSRLWLHFLALVLFMAIYQKYNRNLLMMFKKKREQR
jgi:hypothetical protein